MVFLRSNKKAIPRVQTSVSVSPEFYDLAKEHNISFTEAVRVGISIILAEKGVDDYDNKLNISKMLHESKMKAQEYAKRVHELEEVLNRKIAENGTMEN